MSEECPAEPGAPPLETDPIESTFEVKPPRPEEAWAPNLPDQDREIPVGFLTLALIAALGLAWIGGTYLYRLVAEPPLTGHAAVKAVVERILIVESNGDPDAPARSRERPQRKATVGTATGTGTFSRDCNANGRAQRRNAEQTRPSRHARHALPDLFCRPRRSHGDPVRCGGSRRRHADGERRCKRPYHTRKARDRQSVPRDTYGRRSQELGRSQDARFVISGEREGYSGDDHRGSDRQSGLVKSLRVNDEIVMPNTEVQVLAPSLIDQRVVAACQVTNRIL